MIYSKAFDSLPAPAKTTVYARITAVLSSSGDAAGAALEILESTNSEFAAYRHRR
jgi:hypothetical protein